MRVLYYGDSVIGETIMHLKGLTSFNNKNNTIFALRAILLFVTNAISCGYLYRFFSKTK